MAIFVFMAKLCPSKFQGGRIQTHLLYIMDKVCVGRELKRHFRVTALFHHPSSTITILINVALSQAWDGNKEMQPERFQVEEELSVE